MLSFSPVGCQQTIILSLLQWEHQSEGAGPIDEALSSDLVILSLSLKVCVRAVCLHGVFACSCPVYGLAVFIIDFTSTAR